jgi:hypothetical protein
MLPGILPEAWRPLATAVWGLDLTATRRADRREEAEAAGEEEEALWNALARIGLRGARSELRWRTQAAPSPRH